MLLKYFNSNKAGLQMLFPAIAILLWLHSILNPGVTRIPVSDLAGPLGRLLLNPTSTIPFLAAILGMIIVILYGYLLVQLNVKYFFLKTRSQLPLLFFIIMGGGVLNLRFLSPAMFSALFIIILIYRLFESYKKGRLAFNFLDAGLLNGIAVMIYIPAVFILPILFITLVLFRNTVWQEWVYPCIGFCIPFIFWGSYLFLTDQSIHLMWEDFRRAFSLSGRVHEYSLIQLSFFGYLVLLIIIGSLHMIRTIRIRKIQSRAFFIFFLWFFLLSIIMVWVIPAAGIEIIYFSGISLAFLLSNYFTTCNNTRFNNLLLGLLVAGILMVVADDWFRFFPSLRWF